MCRLHACSGCARPQADALACTCRSDDTALLALKQQQTTLPHASPHCWVVNPSAEYTLRGRSSAQSGLLVMNTWSRGTESPS